MTGRMVWIYSVFLPLCQGLKFVSSPGIVGGDVNQSASLEWKLDGTPSANDVVYFIHKASLVFGYTPYTGIVEPPDYNNDKDFSIYNTTTNGVGFRRRGLQAEDAGKYICRWYGLAESAESSGILLIYDVPSPPVMETTPGDYVHGHTSANLSCNSLSTSLPESYRPAMLYTWSRNGVGIHRSDPPDRHNLLGDHSEALEISSVHYTDTSYACVASENGTNLTSVESKVALNVLYGPLNISVHPEDPILEWNETLVLEAFATCNPNCSFRWMEGSDIIGEEATLVVDGAELNDTETYHVTASNEHCNKSLEITVGYIPQEIPKRSTMVTITTTTAASTTTQHGDVTTNMSNESSGTRCDIMAIAFAVTTAALLVTNIALLDVFCRLRRLYNTGQSGVPDKQTADYVNSTFFRDSATDSTGHRCDDVIGVYEPVTYSTKETPAASVYATLST